jgi:crotonobetainyl-CoA:carnitine CoA-transferase CaiB-like acyl-CoA transferase
MAWRWLDEGVCSMTASPQNDDLREVDQNSGMLLTGVRVLELADELGEYCGKVLAGLGAEVVKIEPPGGEPTRCYGPFYADEKHPDRSLYFWHYNFGKRSVVLDLDDAAGQARFADLAGRADVLLDTRHRGYLSERGLAYDRLRGAHPGLIYARISPFGDSGPWADYLASDLVHLALGGVMMNCGYDANPRGEYDTPPIAPQMWQSYHTAGEQTAIQIVAALCYRNVAGRGQQLSTSVHEAVSGNTEQDTPNWVYARQPHFRHTCGHSYPQATKTSEDAANAAANQQTIVRTKDGRWILPYASYIPVQGADVAGKGEPVDRLIDVMREYGAPSVLLDEWFDDPDFRKDPSFLNATIARFVGRVRADDNVWIEAQAHGLPWMPLRRPEENLADSHWSARDSFFDVEHAELGIRTSEVGAKWVAPGLQPRRGPRAPLVGEHTEEVLAVGSAWLRAPSMVADPVVRVGAGAREKQRLSQRGKPFALAGVRIIDMTWALASAGAGRFFTALGAEVIKIEHESRIDGMRRGNGRAPAGGRAERDAATQPLVTSREGSLNRSGAFMEINSGKLSVSLNLKTERGKELLRDLIRQADMVIEGYSPGTFARMGFGYDQLKALNPDIIYVQQSGTGQFGRYGRMRTFGPSAQAFSGISEMSGLPEPYGPAGIGYSYLDWFGAYHMANAMMAALYHRDRTGKGCWIDSTQVEAGIQLTGTAVLDYAVNGRTWERTGNRSYNKPAAPHGVYRGLGYERWIAIAAFTEQQWLGLLRVLGRTEWSSDPRLSSLDRRLVNQDYLDQLMNEAVASRDVFALMANLQQAGVPAGVCQTAEDRCDTDPQLAHLRWQVELTQSEIGTWPVKEIPVRMSGTPPYIGGIYDRHGPSYGEDTDRVLTEILHLSSHQIADLRTTGVI